MCKLAFLATTDFAPAKDHSTLTCLSKTGNKSQPISGCMLMRLSLADLRAPHWLVGVGWSVLEFWQRPAMFVQCILNSVCCICFTGMQRLCCTCLLYMCTTVVSIFCTCIQGLCSACVADIRRLCCMTCKYLRTSKDCVESVCFTRVQRLCCECLRYLCTTKTVLWVFALHVTKGCRSLLYMYSETVFTLHVFRDCRRLLYMYTDNVM